MMFVSSLFKKVKCEKFEAKYIFCFDVFWHPFNRTCYTNINKIYLSSSLGFHNDAMYIPEYI